MVLNPDIIDTDIVLFGGEENIMLIDSYIINGYDISYYNHSCMLFENNRIHFIGSEGDDTKHMIWDILKNKITYEHCFVEFEHKGYVGFSLTYLKQTNQLLLAGGGTYFV